MAIGARIKGITIEIGGDTTKLQTALKNVNSSINETSKALKDVNKLLKFDTKSTTLLKQKQSLLKQEIKDVKSRLDTEREALAQLKDKDSSPEVKKQMEALERQIADDEQTLKSLKEEFRDFGSVAKQKVQAVGDSMIGLGDKMQTAGRAVSGVGQDMTRTVTTPIVAGLGAAVKITADFDSSMSKLAAVTKTGGEETKAEFDAMREAAIQMGEKTQFTATQAADAMYYMGLAGWTTEEIIAGIPAVLDLAAASGEDLASTSDIVTDALTAFGLTAQDTEHFVDVLAQTSRSSNTDVSQMGEAFKYVAPIAGALNYDIEDVALALGLMADNGIKGSMAGTSLRNILNRLAKPTEEVEGAMAALGLDAKHLASIPLADAMSELRDAFGDIPPISEEMVEKFDQLNEQLDNGTITSEEYKKALEDLTTETYGTANAEKVQYAAMIAGTRGMSGLLAIVNATEEDYGDLANAIDNSTGAADEMARVMRSNLKGQLQILLSKIQSLAIQIGDILMPHLMRIVDFLQGVIDKLKEMDPAQKEQIIRIALIVAAIGPLLLVIGKVITGLGGIIKITGFAVKGFGALLSPVGLVVAALAVLALGIKHLWETNEHFRDTVLQVWENIKTAFADFSSGISERLTKLGIEGDSLGEQLKNAWDALWQYLEPAISWAVEWLGGLVENTFTIILGLFDTFSGLFTGDLSTFTAGLNEIMTGFLAIFGISWEEVKTWLSNAISDVAEFADKIAGFFIVTLPEALETFGGWIAGFFTGIWDSIVATWDLLVAWGAEVITAVVGFFTGIWESIQTAWDTVVAWGSGIITTISEWITSIGAFFTETLPGAFETLVSTVTGKITGLVNTIKDKWDEIKENIATITDTIKSEAETKWNELKNKVTTKAGIIKDTVVNKWQEMKSEFSGKLDAMKQTAEQKFQTIKDKIDKKLQKIKDLFNFEWSFPPIKLPHFTVHYDGREVFGVKLPRVSVDWYRKAYDQPYLFNSPTVVNGRGFGDGNGAEMVYGRDALMRDIAAASQGDITINVYASEGMNINQLADKIQNRLVQLQRQKASAYA